MDIRLTFEPEFDALYESYVSDTRKNQCLEIEGISLNKLDIGTVSHNYFTKGLTDISVDANANANEEISANNYRSEVSKGILKLEGYYLIWKYVKKRFGLARANEALSAIWDGKLYFHDASGAGVQIPYCIAFSTTPLMVEGRRYGQLHSLPAKRSDSFVAQVIETTMDLSQEFVGAVAPSDFIVNLCYFLKRENRVFLDAEDKDYIINLWQKFIHTLNNKFRVSGDSPFTNISIFDRPNIQKIFGEHVYPDGSKIDVDYIMRVQKIIAEFFSKGDPATGLPYRFPIETANISIDENRDPLDDDFVKFIADTNVAKGVYNIYANEGSKIASCCRLLSDTSRMNYRADSFGNGGINIGSHRVVTINFPRIAQEAADYEHFLEILDHRVKLVRDLLVVHREELLTRRIKLGFLKFFYPLEWFNLDMLFSTIGICGLYEMCNFAGVKIEEEEGQQFTTRVLQRLEEYAKQFSEETGYSFNTEEIPGESTAITLAKKDRIANITEQPFELYSNQYVPLIADVGIVERLRLSGKFMNLVSGGGIVHLNLLEQVKTSQVMEQLIRSTLKENVPHFAINYGFGICVNGHTSIVGNNTICPICAAPIKDYLSRIIGYFTKISSWSTVRREYEFPLRKFH